MLRNLDTINYVARSSKNFSTEINFSENIFLVYRGSPPFPADLLPFPRRVKNWQRFCMGLVHHICFANNVDQKVLGILAI